MDCRPRKGGAFQEKLMGQNVTLIMVWLKLLRGGQKNYHELFCMDITGNCKLGANKSEKAIKPGGIKPKVGGAAPPPTI